ncbi:LytR/AlgR family response regulator transcription factor [Flagellimonas lutimaris]|uniref:LytR/AlgR family response regulator transcription factor n=1 Tax=Flagellimonas lutimaris TaxID=475082 RepID=UPI003F5CDBF9
MEKVKILIVEDEILVAKDISNRLGKIGYDIIGTALSAKRALGFMEEHRSIDIILLDIILNGTLDGIELARIINEKYQIPFIFLTSHADQNLVARAKSVKPYAYILKPFNDRQLSVAIELALMNYSHGNSESDLLGTHDFDETDNQVMQIMDSLFLKKKHHFERVPLDEILFLQADSNYSVIYTKKESFVYSTVLKNIELQLPVDKFLRIHRSYVINVHKVKGYEGNTLFIGDKKIPVSKTYKHEVFKLFKTL